MHFNSNTQADAQQQVFEILNISTLFDTFFGFIWNENQSIRVLLFQNFLFSVNSKFEQRNSTVLEILNILKAGSHVPRHTCDIFATVGSSRQSTPVKPPVRLRFVADRLNRIVRKYAKNRIDTL